MIGHFYCVFNGDINAELYRSWEIVVYKLEKSLYGLKKSVRIWFEKLKKALERFGHRNHGSRKCVVKIEM